MRIKPLFVFYLLLLLVILFDLAMYHRQRQIRHLATELNLKSTQLISLYRGDLTNPLIKPLRNNANAKHEKIKFLAKPWPISNPEWNLIFLKLVFWGIIPVLMLMMLWLHFRQANGNRT